MANATFASDLPPLPAYELTPLPDLLPFVSDFTLSLFMPHIAYWFVSMFFHIFDILDVFPQYRLHTPAEITQRNHANRYEVLRDVLIQQAIQTIVQVGLSYFDPIEMTGMQDYEVAVWATRIRLAQRALPAVLGVLGLNAVSLAKNLSGAHPLLAGALSGGHYPFLAAGLDGSVSAVPAFASWELALAKAIYYVIIPFIQYTVAICILDAWQYFWHKFMHDNKWMYATFHSRHHRLYVPYAYGALYNHPLEGLILDTIGAGLGYKVSMMTPRMGLYFFVGSTIKTVDDHCGYAFPWDPLQHLTGNNAAYHDIHHQSWGIKTNYSQPFFTFWDRMLGTKYEGETKLKYARCAAAAEAKEKAAHAKAK